MSDYTPTFTAAVGQSKDATNATASAAELGTEYDAIQTATNSKLDDIPGATTGNIVTVGSSGSTLLDSGQTIASLAPPAATTDVSGVVELATQTEADAGTDTTRAVTPSTLGRIISSGTFSSVSSVDMTFASTDSVVEVDINLTSFVAGTFCRINILEGGVPNTGAIHFGGGKEWDSASGDVSAPINADTYFPIFGLLSTTAGNSPSCRLRIFPNSGAWCVIQAESVYTNNTTGNATTRVNGGQVKSTASNRNGIRLTPSSGNISGSYTVRRYK
jgi:hypothetical protein